ncbi:protein regulator of cytokinesis 1-like [Toxorhynchites rutilus septentrionalis]|uniref:protein regulator of cytokinesis 1-like n=1 Tax=Toxorhynchites rutilus septentrionalis TaxID=329112 RepID=UPI002479EE52|nr:protein regulator of cytokinesis 1-like [Toxorhynchites rutilus septentrionalis]
MDESIVAMESLNEIEKSVIRQAHNIATNSVLRMRNLWSEIFDEQITQDYMTRLPEHVQTFFDEVYEESENRKRKILETIEELREEAANLKRLLQEECIDVNPQPGVPLHQVQINLDRSLDIMREKLKQRYDHIDEFLFEQTTLCEELGETPKELTKDPLPSEAEMCAFRTYLDNLRAEKLQRFDDIAAMRREIKIMMNHLETAPQSERQDELINARNFPPTRYNLTDLRHLHESVSSQYEDLKDNIDRLRSKLATLWNYLAVSPSVLKRYEKYHDYTQTTYDKLFAELDRCETLRRENIQAFVDRTRVEIVQWWDKCLKSEEERSRFSTFNSDVYNEDLLTLHEMELNDLKEYYRNNESIFQLVEQRREMWEKMTMLEQKSHDPSRYNNRGGKLLEEEKERKRISIQLPKIEARLLEACKRYEDENKRKFTVFGECIEEVIREQWNKREEGKLKISSARKKANLGTPTTVNRTAALVKTPKTADTMSKHTSISSRTRLAVPEASLKCSANKQASLSGMLKRKMASPRASAAKRSLLKDLNSPKSFLKPVAPLSTNKSRLLSKSPGKIAAIKIYDTKGGLMPAQKRRSRRKSKSGKARRSASKPRPDIVVTSSTNSTMHSETSSYENFENFFEHNTPNRSSLMPERGMKATTAAAATGAGTRANPRRNLRYNGTAVSSTVNTALSTPSKITFRNPAASSTMLATTLRSPSANMTASGKKLIPASKNCPIIF